MKRTAQDILNFVEDNDVKFVKLTFCDIFGNQKNVSLFASELPRAFERGHQLRRLVHRRVHEHRGERPDPLARPGHRHRAALAPRRGPRHAHVLRHHPAQRQAL